MKIAIDGRCLMDKVYSGVSWYAQNLVTELLKIDNINEYIIFGNSSRAAKLPDFNAPNVTYKTFKYPNKFLNFSSYLFGRPLLDKLVGGADIFFAPNLNFISVSDKTKLVLTVHDLSFLIFPEFFSVQRRLWHKMILAGNLMNRADIVIADSFSTKSDLVNLLKIGDNKIKVVYPGVSGDYRQLENDDPKLAEIKTKYNLPEKFILSLGSLEPRKNLESLFEAYKLTDADVDLVIVGGGGWKNKKIFEKAKDDSRIKMLGYVNEADKIYLYNLAQFLIYPSYYEGFGLPLVEAMACGCPVVAGANSSQSEIVADAGLLINSYDISDIKKAIEVMINDELLRNKFSVRGLVRAQEFTWGKSAQKFLEIFSNL